MLSRQSGSVVITEWRTLRLAIVRLALPFLRKQDWQISSQILWRIATAVYAYTSREQGEAAKFQCVLPLIAVPTLNFRLDILSIEGGAYKKVEQIVYSCVSTTSKP